MYRDIHSSLSPRTLRLLDGYQRDFPLVSRPFLQLANDSPDDWNEAELIGQLQQARRLGVLSRLGCIFAPNTVGSSTLAALAVPPERLESVASFVSSHVEVNHNYLRAHHFNLWFVVAAETAAEVAQVLSRIYLATGLKPLNLPLLREYHVDLGFSFLPDGDQSRSKSPPPPSLMLNWRERRLVSALSAGLSLMERPYQQLAEACGWQEDDVLQRLAHWQKQGVIRRLGFVVSHRELGYKANAMCVWQIDDPAQREAVALRLAEEAAVSLCYERPARLPEWPYHLFCMIHAKTEDQLQQQLDDISQRHQLKHLPSAVLPSLRRYTQRGARYGR